MACRGLLGGVIALLALLRLAAAANPPTLLLKPCPAGCEVHGNCNAEFGVCECRFGFDGDDCSRPLLPACMSSLANGSVPQYGFGFAKNCWCFRQLQRIACSGDYAREVLLCNQPVFWSWNQVTCYEYKDVPEAQQLSNLPEDAWSASVQWRKGLRKDPALGPESFALEPIEAGLPPGALPPETVTRNRQLPLDRCRDRCHERGRCEADAGGGGGAHCVCAYFYNGGSCGDTVTYNCPLSCSGRGACLGGFCHCQPGFWGAGCARSKAYVETEWLPHPTELRIYVYDLPEQVSYMRPYALDEWPIHHTIYLAEIELYHRLLADTAVRTENPWEANLFFIPTHTYYYIGNVGFPGRHFSAVFRHVRETYPWWNLTAGRNHLAATSNDRGCCDLYRMTPDVQHPIKVTHFAQAPRHGVGLPRNGSRGDMGREDPALLAARLHSTLEDPAMVGAMAELQHLGGRPRFRGFPPYELPALQQEREQCFRPEHDVSFPPYISSGPIDGPWVAQLQVAYQYDSGSGTATFRTEVERPLLLYFQGYTKPDMAYSAGVRQGLLALFGDNPRTDLSINKGGGYHKMLGSRFCFTPMGFGWGIRLSQAVFTGCVPVLVHDHVWPYLWDVLPYERFSVRVSRHNLHRLLELLDAITPEQLARLQEGLAQHHRAFVWQPELGGLAYNHTLTSLHHRLTNMWTAIF